MGRREETWKRLPTSYVILSRAPAGKLPGFFEVTKGRRILMVAESPCKKPAGKRAELFYASFCCRRFDLICDPWSKRTFPYTLRAVSLRDKTAEYSSFTSSFAASKYSAPSACSRLCFARWMAIVTANVCPRTSRQLALTLSHRSCSDRNIKNKGMMSAMPITTSSCTAARLARIQFISTTVRACVCFEDFGRLIPVFANAFFRFPSLSPVRKSLRT